MDKELDELISAFTQHIASKAQEVSALDFKTIGLTENNGKLCSDAKNLPTSKNKGKKDMEYYIPKGCLLRYRKRDNSWEARIMIDGKAKTIACRVDKKSVYKELMRVYRELHPKRVKPIKEKELTLFAWLDDWHLSYRMPKLETKELSQNTIIIGLFLNVRLVIILLSFVRLINSTKVLVISSYLQPV